MNEEGILKFLRALDVDMESVRVGDKWVNSQCPMAAWMHAGGVDVHPSFGIAIDEERRSVYYCFGCTFEVRDLSRLLHNIWLMSGAYPHEAAGIFAKYENHDSGKPKKTTPDGWLRIREKKKVKPLPPKLLKLYPLLQAQRGYEKKRCIAFLERERGIPEWVANMCGVRLDTDNSALVFPLTNILGSIYYLRERLRKSKTMWTVNADVSGVDIDFPSLKDVGVWFNMHNIEWTEPVILVEGELDAMRLIALGRPNVVAATTSNLTDKQIDALAGETLWLGFDADKAGEFAHARISDRIGNTAEMWQLRWDVARKKTERGVRMPGDLHDRDSLDDVLRRKRKF